MRAPLGWEESAQLAVLADLDGLGLVARGSRVEGLEVLLATTTHDHDLQQSVSVWRGQNGDCAANAPRLRCGRERTWGSLEQV